MKANLFRGSFREQCRPITNDSSFSNNQIIESVTRLSDFNIGTDTIIKIIHSRNPGKAHSCDGILTRIKKLCETSISNLYIFF